MRWFFRVPTGARLPTRTGIESTSTRRGKDHTVSMRGRAMWVRIRSLGIFVLFVSLASVSPGATITGSLKGSEGAPFAGAFVQVQNTKTKITVNVLSNKDGRYRVENLPAGEYDLRIRAIGYKSE